MKLRTIVTIFILFGAVFVAGLYWLNRPEPEMVVAAAVPAPSRAAVNMQATTAEQIIAQPITNLFSVYENSWFNYRVNYPGGWLKQEPSTNVVILQAPNLGTEVKVEAVGPLPADGLTPFVDRSLGADEVISRQLLTIQGYTAERVITIAASTGRQETTFYVDAGQSAYVISGFGEQKAIEQIARSFSPAEAVAQQ
jgi:hypothetical protein